eukprot:TRINITY_DN8782_c0_g2_i1.p1 TRINITY_DN8782_c0_g2~~TRINITY_DN8782_c0_g2_i1.p1  ORF type:complete len:772 (-),score=64.58 TRINITY_DN8782_c0_g2_i1:82-2397(-)
MTCVESICKIYGGCFRSHSWLWAIVTCIVLIVILSPNVCIVTSPSSLGPYATPSTVIETAKLDYGGDTISLPLASESSLRPPDPLGGQPRVLMYSWHDSSAGVKPFVKDKAPAPASAVYWKNCYAHLHGFDLIFASEEGEENEKMTKDHTYHNRYNDDSFWAMMRGIQHQLFTGRYDYVFLMIGDVSINDMNLDYPVQSLDHGHDITLMDMGGMALLNGILFKRTTSTQRFIEELLLYQTYTEQAYIRHGQAAFLEMLLRVLGREAHASGKPGYNDTCWDLSALPVLVFNSQSQNEGEAYRVTTAYDACFFRELDRLAGAYGNRDSKIVGFSKTFVWREKVLTYHDVRKELPLPLEPMASCGFNFRHDGWSQGDCFAFDFNQPGGGLPVQTISKCPAKTFAWGHYYGGNDLLWFRDWSQRSKFPTRPPRVLIFTWQTENAFTMFDSEVHSKACYAHAHGFDVVFSETVNVTGEAHQAKIDGKESASQQWYNEKRMWAWNREILRFLFSGKYDYVFYTGADVLFNYMQFDFPVWAYDTGHDVTVMDQDFVGWGLNENAVLFKPTPFAREFIDAHYGYRGEFWTQSDNGPWMDVILVFIGREAELAGQVGYKNICKKHGLLNMTMAVFNHMYPREAWERGFRFCTCFFAELNRMAGPYRDRKSKQIGFTKTSYFWKGQQMLPANSNILHPKRVMPWANCFDYVRQSWPQPVQNCLAYHWNGARFQNDVNAPGLLRGDVAGSHASMDMACPDPSYTWTTSPWNHENRKKRNPEH